MKLAMATLQLVLIQLCISLSLVDCQAQQEKVPPRPKFMWDPSGYYSLLNANDPTIEGSSQNATKPLTDPPTRNQEFRRRIRNGTYIPNALGSTHSLAQFIMKSQTGFDCSETRCRMKNGSLEYTKTDVSTLPPYGLTCTDREWFSPEDKELVIYVLRFRLIPGVCFTRNQHLSFCDQPKIRFPTDSKCVTFFRDWSCSGGEMVTIYSGGLDILESAIVGSKSFAFC